MPQPTPEETERELAKLVFAEKNHSLHTIRERVLNVLMWYAGGVLVVTAWFASDASQVTLAASAVVALALIIASGALHYFVKNDENGFYRTRQILKDAELVLGFYSESNFPAIKKSLYPAGWLETKPGKAKGKFFRSIYILLWVFTGLGLLGQILLHEPWKLLMAG